MSEIKNVMTRKELFERINNLKKRKIEESIMRRILIATIVEIDGVPHVCSGEQIVPFSETLQRIYQFLCKGNSRSDSALFLLHTYAGKDETEQ